MTGYNFVLRLRRFEQEIDKLGFRMGHPKHGGFREIDMICLMPKDSDVLPVYARDAELYIGTIEQAEEWLRGVQWARQYDNLLRLSDDKKRARKEQDERNRQLLRKISEVEPHTAGQ
jgi:hypothetical protein